ncbi:MAG: hypothetical protein HY860_02870 [Chlamydiales bacterium]|nr:hypothetical protein [Chlamydiales bacterium]
MEISPLGPSPALPIDPKQQAVEQLTKRTKIVLQDIDIFLQQATDPNIQAKQLTDTFKTQLANGIMFLQKYSTDIPGIDTQVDAIQGYYERNILYENDITDIVASTQELKGMIGEVQESLPT